MLPHTNKCKHIGFKLLGSSELMCFKYVCKYVWYHEFLNHQFFVVKWSVLYLVIHSLIFSLVYSIYSVLFSCGYALHCNSFAIQRLVQAANVSTEVFAFKAPQSRKLVICIRRPAFCIPAFVCNIDKRMWLIFSSAL